MMKTKVTKWLQAQSEVIDEIIAEAAQNFWREHRHLPNFAYDLTCAQEESYLLSKGKDLCYDRLTTPLSYSLWYQGRRINGCISFFLDALTETSADRVTVFDLGAGTGAAQMAADIVSYGLNELTDKRIPEIHFVNIDSSPLMLNYNENYLWPACAIRFPSNNRMQATFSLNSWHNPQPFETDLTWLTTSYVFDVSDQVKALKKDFLKIIEQYSPNRIFLSSSTGKKRLLDTVAQSAKEVGYNVKEQDCTSILNGDMPKTNAFRKELSEYYHARGLNKEATFRESVIYSKSLEKRVSGRQLKMINLYNEKITEINRIKLSEEQEAAVNFIGRPSKIVGSAGSGKTIVICQKAAKLVKDSDYDPKLQILITTFNKELVRLIKKWIVTLLDERKISIRNDRNEHQIAWNDLNLPNIRIMHFDILPTRFGQIDSKIVAPIEQLLLLEKVVEEYLKNNLDASDAVKNKLTPEFLLEEYCRVFYGNNIRSKEQYLSTAIIDPETGTQLKVRAGRGEALQPHQKEAVYECIRSYMSRLSEKGHSFIDRRRIFLTQIQKSECTHPKFDYVFVDEFQDCTRTDFKIFYHLLKDPNNLTITGDLAQSIHLGKSATSDLRAIGGMNGIELKKFQPYNLSASYRLPYRVSEAVSKISEIIVGRWEKDNSSEKGNLLALKAVKNSFPGARPIIVSGEDSNEIAKKVRKIAKHYRGFGIDRFTLLENDRDLASVLWKLGMKGRRDSILSMKGMETPLIIWSSRISVADQKEIYEYLYTIFTRTSSILILALFPETLEIYRKPLSLLRDDRLIFWDYESEKKYHNIINKVELKQLAQL